MDKGEINYMPYKDPEKARQYYDTDRKQNKERYKKYQIKYRETHPERISESKKKWLERNPEYNKEYYQANREKIIGKSKIWRKINHKKILEKVKLWQKDHPDEVLERIRKYSKTEKGKACKQRVETKRRVRMREIINTLTAKEWLDILEKYNYVCAYCGTEFGCENLPTKDHVIPISKGGNNVKENIVPACRSCNAKKHTKILIGGNSFG